MTILGRRPTRASFSAAALWLFLTSDVHVERISPTPTPRSRSLPTPAGRGPNGC